MSRFFATTFDDNVNKIRREKFIDAIVYCLLSNSLYDLFENNQLIQLLNNSIIVSFLINSCKINVFVVETSFIQCILIDFLLILSNVNFLSFFCFEIVLHSYKFSIAFSRWNHVLSLKSSWNFLLCFCWNQRLIHLSYFDDLNVKNSFCMKVSTSCANFFNRFNVFDLWLLLWVVENSKWLTFVVKNDNEIEWLKSRA